MIWPLPILSMLLLTVVCLVAAYAEADRPKSEDAFWGNVEGAEGHDGPRLSLRLEEADIRGLLTFLADQRGISVLISDEVEGTLSMSLTDVCLLYTSPSPRD